MVWDVSRVMMAKVLSDPAPDKSRRIPVLSSLYEKEEYQRRLQIVPLGWTVDPRSFWRSGELPRVVAWNVLFASK
jgi:hypothetical protein